MHNNYVYIKIPSLSVNESFARAAVAAFCSSLNPTVNEITEIKTPMYGNSKALAAKEEDVI
jgi:stage II sporulation protein AB (anti-sigma F factor)